MNSRRSAGFPSPAADYLELKLDLNQLLVKHRESTFFMRVDGDSMIGAGIHSGDLIVVDRALPIQHKKIAVVVLDGELLLKRFIIDGTKVTLQSENPEYAAIELGSEANLEVWGVVTSVIHEL
ncbi:MAG: translesion error-prone DNA polymerase V autoproteolytic subunit [Candidatus Obscuribacter sp.]|nr:translesion error-prone DNA polymerase V autoproteolytic subunit [Candidatus Obscuribacter sp.]MBP7578475.1 translesion error-prone DNA polymerase V autoproteolytic subunit [Candidatus Obscuribacter sp.]